MTAKPNVEVTPAAASRLRTALAVRDQLGATSSEIMKKIERLAPLEADVATARGVLQQILQADAEALHAWVNQDAKGSAPDTNAKAREEAGRKLSAAQARLAAAGGVKAALEQELVENNTKLHAHQQVIASASVDAIGEEALRSVERMRRASLDYLESEANLDLILGALGSFGGPLGQPNEQSRRISDWLTRIKEANKLTDQERAEATQRVIQRTQDTVDALLRGDEPVG